MRISKRVNRFPANWNILIWTITVQIMMRAAESS